MISAIIIDDEQPARFVLQSLLKRHFNDKLIVLLDDYRVF